MTGNDSVDGALLEGGDFFERPSGTFLEGETFPLQWFNHVQEFLNGYPRLYTISSDGVRCQSYLRTVVISFQSLSALPFIDGGVPDCLKHVGPEFPGKAFLAEKFRENIMYNVFRDLPVAAHNQGPRKKGISFRFIEGSDTVDLTCVQDNPRLKWLYPIPQFTRIVYCMSAMNAYHLSAYASSGTLAEKKSTFDAENEVA